MTSGAILQKKSKLWKTLRCNMSENVINIFNILVFRSTLYACTYSRLSTVISTTIDQKFEAYQPLNKS